MNNYDYDLFVIGGGSAGLSAAKQAAQYGVRVALAEPSFLGGTCVARGCIPKKLMVYASRFSQLFADAAAYGWRKSESEFSWSQLIETLNREVDRLDQLHRHTLAEAGIQLFSERARFIDTHALQVGNEKITADKILIAVGGTATRPNISGIEHALTSDQMFRLPQQPQRLAIIGGGYIGVEFAGIMRGLGSQVTQIVRGDKILENFDQMISAEMQKGMTRHGVNFLMKTEVTEIMPVEQGLRLSLSGSSKPMMVDAVLVATGRLPKLAGLGLEDAGVEVKQKAIAVNADSQTSQTHIYAVGDCTNRVQLTPVAIAEGRAAVETIFGNQPCRVSYQNIPSSVFGHPPAAVVGLTEAEAVQQFGSEHILVYRNQFTPLFYSATGRDELTSIKLVVEKNSDRLLGAHMIGDHAAEIIQGIAIAVNAGLTKADIDKTLPLHPTSAEEFVMLKAQSNA